MPRYSRWPQKFKSMSLLSGENPKTSKGISEGYITWLQYLSPYKTGDGQHNLCARAQECIRTCLTYAGHGGMQAISKSKAQAARRRRTLLFLTDRVRYAALLEKEVRSALAYTARFQRRGHRGTAMIPCFRLNGLSDIPWESVRWWGGRSIIEVHGDRQFYDYTKVYDRFARGLPDNYFLLLSAQAANIDVCRDFLRRKVCNVAVVFLPDPALHPGLAKRGLAKPMPTEWWGAPVLNGDKSDLRFQDAELRGAVIGLHYKISKRDPESGARLTKVTSTTRAKGGLIQNPDVEAQLVTKFTNSQVIFDPERGGIYG